MHLLLAGFIGIITFYKGNWSEWSKYALTIFYVIILNLLYELLCHDKLLWQYIPDFSLKSSILTTLLYSLFILPAITFLYLSIYPFQKNRKQQIYYILKWIILSTLIEYVYTYFNIIEFNNGYMYWMEPLFYIAMYTMIRLHHTRPILTYGFTLVIIIFLLLTFNIPLK